MNLVGEFISNTYCWECRIKIYADDFSDKSYFYYEVDNKISNDIMLDITDWKTILCLERGYLRAKKLESILG